MTVVYLDLSGGADEAALLGAVLAAGAPIDAVRRQLAHLPFSGCTLRAVESEVNGLRALRAVIEPRELENICPDLRDVAKQLSQSGPEAGVREKTAAVLERLAAARERVYGPGAQGAECVAAPAVAAIAGTVAALCALGATLVACSPLPVGTGLVKRGGKILPNPSPLVLALLENVPVFARDVEAELLTPAAAALVTTLAGEFGPMPAMRIGRAGYGAGETCTVRAVAGKEMVEFLAPRQERAVILEANLDDLNPEIYGYVMERLFAAGALDVYFTPIQMKKNRPGTLLRVLCRQGEEGPLLEILFKETTTLGVRRLYADKLMLERHWVMVETPYGKARVKVATRDGRETNCVPEYEDCVKLARQSGLPLKDIYQAVIKAYFHT